MPGIKEVRVGRHIYRRGDKYRLRYHGQSTTLDTLQEAQFLRDQKQAEFKKQRKLRTLGLVADDAPVEAIRFSELVKRFEEDVLNDKQPVVAAATRRSYRESLAVFTDYFVKRQGDPLIGAIKRKTVKAFVKWRRLHPKPVSKRTVQKDATVLSRVFDYALESEWVEANPVSGLKLQKILGKIPKRQPVILTSQQFDLLTAACAEDQTRTYVLLLAETGLRAESEALWLRRDDVDLDAGFVEVVSGRDGHDTKSGKSRSVPITPRLREALEQHLKESVPSSRWLFCHQMTRRHHKAGERITSLRRAVKTAARLAGLPKQWHVHDLRHRRVTTWLAAGKPLAIVQDAMGHSDPRVTDGYKHLAKAHLGVLAN